MSVVVIVLPKMEDAKKIRKILMGHGFPQVFAYATASAALSEIREHESGMVISGYHLKDMYYTELADSLPPHFELVLLGSASTVSAADTGILSGQYCRDGTAPDGTDGKESQKAETAQ